MGCCSSRGALLSAISDEERVIVNKEVNLGFQKLQVANIAAMITELSEKGTISQNAFNVMTVEMALNRTDMDTPNSPINRMYAALKNDSGKFDQLKLAVLGILLGRGTATEKAEAYFTTLQEEDALTQTQARLLFEALFTVASEILPILVHENDDLGVYLNKLKSGETNLVTRCTNALMQSKSKVTKQDMRTAFLQDENLTDLVSPYAVRMSLKKEAEIMANGTSISGTSLIRLQK